MKRITEEGSHPIKAWLGMKQVPVANNPHGTATLTPAGYIEQVLDLEDAALTQLKGPLLKRSRKLP